MSRSGSHHYIWTKQTCRRDVPFKLMSSSGSHYYIWIRHKMSTYDAHQPAMCNSLSSYIASLSCLVHSSLLSAVISTCQNNQPFGITQKSIHCVCVCVCVCIGRKCSRCFKHKCTKDTASIYYEPVSKLAIEYNLHAWLSRDDSPLEDAVHYQEPSLLTPIVIQVKRKGRS